MERRLFGYQNGDGNIGRVPILEEEVLTKEEFLLWFHRHKPDFIVGHRTEALRWLASERFRVPEDVGYFTLNQTEATVLCAGLDLAPEAQGAEGIGAVVGQILRFEDAIQRRPEITLIEGGIGVEGPTRASPGNPKGIVI